MGQRLVWVSQVNVDGVFESSGPGCRREEPDLLCPRWCLESREHYTPSPAISGIIAEFWLVPVAKLSPTIRAGIRLVFQSNQKR
jgi:hypothetical protein